MRKYDRIFWKKAPPQDQKSTTTLNHIFGSYSKIGTPMGCTEDMEIYLKRTGKFVPEHYTWPAYDIMTQEQVTQKIDDIRQMQVIIVPITTTKSQEQQKIDIAQNEGDLLKELWVFPLPYHMRHEPILAEYQWTQFIQNNFTTIRKIAGVRLMFHNDKISPANR
jgi:hypothetical protein